MGRRILLLSLLFFVFTFLHAQEETPTYESILEMSADTHKVYAWINLSKETAKSDLSQAEIFGDSALALAIQLVFEKGIALAHRQLGAATFYGSQYEKAIEHWEYLVDYYRRTNDEINEAKILNNLGLVKRNQGKHDESMQLFFQSLEIKERYPDVNSQASTHRNIGENYAILENFEKAEEHFTIAMEAYKSVDNMQAQNTMLLNLAGFYRDTKDIEKAMEYLPEPIAYFAENGPKIELARGYYILAGLHFDKDELDASETAFLKSQAIFDTLGAEMRSIGCIYYRAEIALKQKNYTKAAELGLSSLDRSKAAGTLHQTARGYNLLARIQRAAGNHAQAYEYLESFQSTNDSIINKETNTTIAELQEKYQAEVQERQLAELSATNQVNELTLKRQRNQQIALLIFVLLVLTISVLIYNQYRQKKRSNELLVEKNAVIETALKEKEVLLREIHHRVKNNLQFIGSLFNIQQRFISDPEVARVMNESKDRINSISLLHQKLYQEDNLTGVEMNSYVSNLKEALIHSCNIDRTKIQITTSIENVRLDVDTAIPIGLILNEAITNAFKYAFAEAGTGNLNILLAEEEQSLHLNISDDGIGLPSDFDLENSTQFGYELIRSLAGKLKADLTVAGENGTTLDLRIRKYEKI